MKKTVANRRKFIQSGLTATAGFLALTADAQQPPEKLGKDMFVHSVYFWLKPDLNETQKAQFKKGLNSLTEIESVFRAFIGAPAPTNRPIIDRSYSYALLLVFKDQKAHDQYQDDPIHEKFRQECSSLWSKVVIYDCM
jgi:hypothetical protein